MSLNGEAGLKVRRVVGWTASSRKQWECRVNSILFAVGEAQGRDVVCFRDYQPATVLGASVYAMGVDPLKFHAPLKFRYREDTQVLLLYTTTHPYTYTRTCTHYGESFNLLNSHVFLVTVRENHLYLEVGLARLAE